MTPDTILALGIDQAQAGPSGIVLAEYHVAGGATPILGFTTRGLEEMIEAFIQLTYNYPDITVIAHEGGFFDPRTPKGGEGTWVSGGWVEALTTFLWRDAVQYTHTAKVWRKAVHGYVDMTQVEDVTAAWKAHTLQWAQADDPNGVIGNEHEADALGILSCACQKHIEKHGVPE